MLEVKVKGNNAVNTRVLADLRISASEDHRQLLYTGLVRGRQVPISYIGMQNSSPSNIKIDDINEVASGFRRRENSFTVRHSRRVGRSFTASTRDILITDQVIQTPFGNTPVFYTHKIEDASGDLGTIVLRDHLFNEIDPSEWSSILSGEAAANANASVVYINHNLHSSFDSEDGSYTIFFLEYTNYEGDRKLVLLDQKPIYRRATIEDGLDVSLRTYTTRKRDDGFSYVILFRRDENGAIFNGPWYVKVTEDFQLKLHKPLLATPNERWSLSISDGEVFSSGLVDGDVAISHFSIPEYHLQNFNPVEPKKFVKKKECFLLDKNLVALPFRKVLTGAATPISVLVTNRGLEPKFGFTTSSEADQFWDERLDEWDPAHREVMYRLSSAEALGVSFSPSTGLMHIPVDMELDDRVFVQAFYEQDRFEYSALNLNPIHNSDLLGNRSLVYVVSEERLATYPAGVAQFAVNHLIFGKDNEIISFTDHELAADINAEFNYSNLKNAYKQAGSTSYEQFLAGRTDILILGVVSIARRQRIQDLSVIDIREQGGTLTKEVEESIIEKLSDYPELLWLSESSVSGAPLPVQGAIQIRLPRTLLSEAGGEFTRKEIEETVRRYMALGGYPIIEYYLPKPVITSSVLTFGDNDTGLSAASLFELEWTGVSQEQAKLFEKSLKLQRGPHEGDPFRHAEDRTIDTASSYNVYIGGVLAERDIDSREQRNYFKVEEITFAADSLSASFAPPVELLRDQSIKEVYIYVVPVHGGQEWERSEIIKIDLYDSAGNMRVTDKVSFKINGRLAPAAEVSLKLQARIQ